MSGQFNKLTPAEHERLVILSEEMSEASQEICKILRHGYDGFDPDKDRPTNRVNLETELGHVCCAMIRLCDAGDLSMQLIHDSADEKKVSSKRWLRHQDE